MRNDRLRYGSSILALIAMVLAAFCPVCVFSMFFGAVSLGIGLAMSSYSPIFLGFAVVFSIPFSWRGYQWLKKGTYAKFKIRSFTTLQLILGTALFLLGLLSQNFIMMGGGYVACLLIPIVYKIRLKGHRNIAVLLLFALLSSALLGRVVVASLSPRNNCILCGTNKLSNEESLSVDKSGNSFGDSLIIINVDRILASGKPAFLFFHADWCHFCQKEKPIIEDLKAKYQGKIDFIFLNEKDNDEAMQTFGVEAFPTMFLVVEKKGTEYLGSTMSGYTEEQQLANTIDDAIAKKGKTTPIAIADTTSVQISQDSPGIEQLLINSVALSILFFTPAVLWKKRETMKTHLKPKPWIGITLSIIIIGGIFSSLPQLVGGDLQHVEENSSFDLAMIRALEQTGFGSALDSVIDKVLSSGRFVFLFFYADWCHFCQKEKPIVAELEPLYSDEIIFIHLNNAKNPEAMEEFGVEGFPTMFLIYGKDNGEYIYQIFSGFTEKAVLKSVFESLIENSSGFRSIATSQDDGTTDGYIQHSCSTAKCLKECLKQNMHFTKGELFSKLMGLLTKCAGFGKAREAFETAYKGAEASECAAECIESKEKAESGQITDARAEANCFRCAISNALQDIPVIGEELACPLTAMERMYDILATPADCLAECANDPSTWSQDWGHECRDHRSPDKYVCVSPSAKGKLVCSQCEWMVDPKSTLPCPAGTECQETPNGPTCIRECKPSECDDGDPCTVDRCMSAYWGGQGCVHWPTPGCDKPDDSYDVSSISLAESTPTYKQPDVGVLSGGFTPILLEMLRNLGLEGASIDASLQGMKDYPVLIIPSGALSGLDSSPTFKSGLAQYVNNGGTLIVFSQQHGYEYQALPSGNLTGFGWLEDQSCQLSSVAVSTYHPIVSGQNSPVLNVNVDGFFTFYPQNSSLLLSRTKNGMPAMLMYNYGYGRVVATTLYSDMASGIYQGTNDEKILMKNLVRWAMTEGPTPSYAPGLFTTSINVTNPYPSPVTYPVQEFSAGDTVNLQVNVKNPGNTTADKVSFILFDPAANKFWVNVTDSIQAGQSKLINLTYQTASSSKSGLWNILYSVSSGNSFICMSYGGEFALNYNINDLSQLTSFVTVFDPDNNAVLTQNNMSFTVLPGKTGSINFTLNSDKLGIWTARYSVSTKDGKVLISSSSSFAVSKLKENPEGFAYSWSDLTFSMTSDQETYEYGSKALFTFHLWNKGSEDKNVTANWGYASKWIVVPAKGYTSFNYTLSSVLYSGRLKARFYVDGIEVGYSEKGFWMVYPYVKTHIETDSRIYMRGETVSITLNLENSQAIAHNLQASVQVKHTSGTKLCESSFNISMPADSAENRTFSFVLPSDLTFGTYNVVSEINEGVNQIAYDATYFEVPEHVKRFEFDKSSYKVGDYLGISLFLGNNLPASWHPAVEITITDLGFSDSGHFDIPQGRNRILSYKVAIPETLQAGKHSVLIKYVEEDVTSEFSFLIPESKLELIIGPAWYLAGEYLRISLKDTGGVATNYTYQTTFWDPFLNLTFEQDKTGLIRAGETIDLGFPISDQAVSGDYFLIYSLKNLAMNETSSSMETFNVDGLSASIVSQTNKRIYSVEDVITLLTTIVNSGVEIKDAVLNLKIQSTAPAPPKQCVIPYDDLYVNEDTILCPGVYSLTDTGQNGLIIINADGITLEGGNTTLVQANPGYTYQIAILNPGFNDVTIKNIETKDFHIGVELAGSINSLVTNMTISSPARYSIGIYLDQYASNNIVTDNNIFNLWGDAFYLNFANNNTIISNRIDQVGGNSVYAEHSNGNTIKANIVNNTRLMMELDYSDENTITENILDKTAGIYLYFANGNTISWNSLVNGTDDSLLAYESDNNLIISNLMISNGIYLSYSDNNTISNTRVTQTINGPGIYLEYSNGNTVSNCTAGSNGYGISLANSNSNNITDNTFCSNTYYDIAVSSGSVNSGVSNTCNSTQNWNDQGATGCTYDCSGVGSASCTPWSTAIYTSDESLSSARSSAYAMSFASSLGDVIWERNIPVDVTDLKEISDTVGKLSLTGKLYLYATLYSSTGQVIATSVYPFYVSDQDLALTMETDRAMYKPGETVKITGSAENRGLARNATLTIKADGVTFYSQNITLATNASFPFASSIIASKSLTLEGLLDGVNVTEHVLVGVPSINASIIAPDIVGMREFNVTISIQNTGNITTNLSVAFGTNSWNLTIPVGELKTLSVKMAISEDTVVTVDITGDIVQTLQKTIVLGEIVDVEVTPETVYLEGSVGIPYTVSNTGSLDSRFNASFSLNGQTITREIYVLSSASVSDTVYFNLTKGMYILKYESPFWTNSVYVDVESDAQLIVKSIPQNMDFHLGEEANLTITVENIGGRAGKAQLRLQSPGLIDEYKEAWVESGQEINITFALVLPDDVEEKNYTLYLDLNGERYETTFFMQGAKVSVTGALDKPFYKEGENATFTVKVENLRDMSLPLFTRVRLGEYDVAVYFNLTGFQSKTLSFSLPVVFNSEKLLYAVYLVSGRSLYINSAYTYPEPPDSAGITLYTDRQVYEAGETAKIFVNATKSGRLVVKSPALNVNTTLEVGSTFFTFEVPLLRSGTYPLEYSFGNFTSSYPIDIIGYSARIIESSIDKQIYQAADNLNVNLVIDINRGFAGQLQAFILNPQNWIVGTIAIDHTFAIGENKISLTVPLITNQTGMHSVVFKLYAYGSFIFLASGARYFDTYVPPDTTPPVIEIVDVTNQLDVNRPITQGEPLAVNAMVTDNVNVVKVVLYYRRPGENYMVLEMSKCPECIDAYNCTIPASFVTTSTIEYYINATDGINFTTYPAVNPSANPEIIHVNLYPTAVLLDQPIDVTQTSVKLSWTQNADSDFKNYTIWQSNSQGSLGSVIFTSTDQSLTSYTVPQLTADTTYYFTVRVYDTSGLYADSNQVGVKTLPPAGNVAPSAVTLYLATDVTRNSLKLSWSKNTDSDFKNYVVHQSMVAGSVGTATITVTDSSLTSCTVTGLSADTTYHLTIRVYDSEGLYADSNQIAVTTLPPEAPLFPLMPIAGGLVIAAIAIVIIIMFVMKRRKKG